MLTHIPASSRLMPFCIGAPARAEQQNTALLAVCSEDCRAVKREFSAKHVRDWETDVASC
jgi:hypothetical protein